MTDLPRVTRIVALLLIVGLLALASLLLGEGRISAQVAGKQWEYLKLEPWTVGTFVITGNDSDLIPKGTMDVLDDLGRQGWELVTVGYYETGSAALGYTVNEAFYLKREK